MESGLKSPNNTTVTVDIPITSSRIKEQPALKHELIDDLAILEDSLTTGREYLEATTILPSPDTFRALYLGGYCEYGPHDVERIFGSWDIFEGDVVIANQDYKNTQRIERERILEIIELDKGIGILHPRLFLDTKATKSEEQKANNRRQNNLHIFLDTEVSDDKKIERYVKFKIAEQLTSNLESEEQIKKVKVNPLTRRTSIALGYNVESGLTISSFRSEIGKSNSALTIEEIDYQIEEIAKSNNWMHYLYPEAYQHHLDELVKLASAEAPFPAPDSYYSLADRSFVSHDEYKVQSPEDVQTRQIYRIGELLVRQDIEIQTLDENKFDNHHSEYKNWDQRLYLEYGRWIIQAINPYQINLDRAILRRASRLGIGPGVKRIKRATGSVIISEYFDQLGTAVNYKPQPQFAGWKLENYVDLVRKIAEMHDGKVTKKIIRERIQNGADEPSVHYYDKIGGLNFILKEAGFSGYNEALDCETIIDACLSYHHQTGEIPTKDSFRSSAILPSDYSVAKYFGGIKNLQRELQKRLNSLSDGVLQS